MLYSNVASGGSEGPRRLAVTAGVTVFKLKWVLREVGPLPSSYLTLDTYLYGYYSI